MSPRQVQPLRAIALVEERCPFPRRNSGVVLVSLPSSAERDCPLGRDRATDEWKAESTRAMGSTLAAQPVPSDCLPGSGASAHGLAGSTPGIRAQGPTREMELRANRA